MELFSQSVPGRKTAFSGDFCRLTAEFTVYYNCALTRLRKSSDLILLSPSWDAGNDGLEPGEKAFSSDGQSQGTPSPASCSRNSNEMVDKGQHTQAESS